MSILNLITNILAYSDPCQSDNPSMRNVDWSRKLQGISIVNPKSDSLTVPPLSTVSIFNGSRATGLVPTTSLISLSLISNTTSVYQLSVSGTNDNFRISRSVSGITNCTVTTNNNSVASFDFGSANLSSVQIGDVFRVNGTSVYDSGTFAFSPLNSGYWTVISVSGSVVQCVRPVGTAFMGIGESATSVAGDVLFFSASSSTNVNIGDKISITGTLSSATQRTYQILDVQPNRLLFSSVMPLPSESDILYQAGTINIYSNAKRFSYIEADQDCVIRFNGDTTDANQINPLVAGDPQLPGYINKVGSVYSCVVVNKSLSVMNLKTFFAE